MHHFTGCTRHPQPDSHYCWEHKSGDSPVIAAENVSSRTRQKLKGTKDTKNYSEEQYFIVESIKEITKENLYKVKWVGFEDETLEPEENIPGFIIKFYKDNPHRVGERLPDPVIKATKKVYYVHYDKALYKV